MGRQGTVVWRGIGGVLMMKYRVTAFIAIKWIVYTIAAIYFIAAPNICFAEQKQYLSKLTCDSFVERCNLFLEDDGDMIRLASPCPIQEDFTDSETQAFLSEVNDDVLQHVTSVEMYVKHNTIVGIDVATTRKDNQNAILQAAAGFGSSLITIGVSKEDAEKVFNNLDRDNFPVWSPLLGGNVYTRMKIFGGALLLTIRPNEHGLY